MATRTAKNQLARRLEEFADLIREMRDYWPENEPIDIGDRFDNAKEAKEVALSRHQIAHKFDDRLVAAKRNLLAEMPDAPPEWLDVFAPVPGFDWKIEDHQDGVRNWVYSVTWPVDTPQLNSIINAVWIEVRRADLLHEVKNEVDDRGRPLHYTPAELDILNELKNAQRRLTTSQFEERLEKGGKASHLSELKKNLAVLVRYRQLTNDPNADPPGYGLPEWS